MKIINVFVVVLFSLCLFSWQANLIAEDDLDVAIAQALNYAEQDMGNAENAPEVSVREGFGRIEMQPQKSKKGAIMIDTLELKGMDILDVLKLISKKSGLNIAAGANVKGKVTIYLQNVDVWDVLRIILETNDLAYEEVGNIIKVITEREYEQLYGRRFSDKTQVKNVPLYYASTADLIPLLTQMKSVVGKVFSDEKSNTIVLIDTPEKIKDMEDFIRTVDMPLSTQVFSLNYSKAEDLKDKISGALTKNVGTVNIDARTNKMVVRDTPAKVEEIKAMVAAFDERHREVLIEAKIVQVTLGDEFSMGIDWQYLASSQHNLNLQGNFDVLSATDKFGKVSIGTLSADEYTAFIEALDSMGSTNILSSPHITTLNNQEAKILVGSNEPYVTTTTTTPASGPTTTSEAVNFIEVGVKLYVTPSIGKDDFITMKIRPEISSVTNTLTTSENNEIPIVETSQAETNVMVKDGTTIVIGGLIKDTTSKTVNKIPLLGDIPLLGLAFQNRSDETEKTETIIFLTPHIISGESDSYEVTQMPDFFKKKGY